MPTGTDVRQNLAVEREKLLAARGWETDRERTVVLRELLERSLQRVFLWSFSQLRSRDKAVELTRNTLLWASRTLGQVPEGRLLDHWIFEHLAADTPARLDLLRSELGPEPCQVLGEGANQYYLEAYPACGELRSAYLTYQAMSEDNLLVKRAGWSVVRGDLERFLEGHFGEENAQASETKDPLPHRLGRLSFRQTLPILLFLGLLGYVVWLRGENEELQIALDAEIAQHQTPATAQQETPTAPGHLRNLTLEVGEQLLTLSWDPVSRADSYRLVFLTAKMDTLLFKANISTARTMVRLEELHGFDPQTSSCVYKVEGLRGERVIATSGMVIYPPI